METRNDLHCYRFRRSSVPPQYAGLKSPAAARPQRPRERPPAGHTRPDRGTADWPGQNPTVRHSLSAYTFGGSGWGVGEGNPLGLGEPNRRVGVGCHIIPGCGSPGCRPAAHRRLWPIVASRRDFGAWHGSQRLTRLSRSWVPPKAWGRMWSTWAAGPPHFWQVWLSRVRAACRRWAGAPPLVGLSHCLPMVLPPWVAAVLWRFMRDGSPFVVFVFWSMCCLLCCVPVPWPAAGGAGGGGGEGLGPRVAQRVECECGEQVVFGELAA